MVEINKSIIEIGGKKIGQDLPCFIVAEAGVNHNGSLEMAKQLVVSAKDAGADAVKFQIFITDEIVSPEAPKADYQTETTGAGSQYEMLKKLALDENEFRVLKDFANNQGIIFFATPHDLVSVDIFDRLDLPAIKVASPDLNNALLFSKLARNSRLYQKPLFLSTGASTMNEVRASLRFLWAIGFQGPVVLLQCVSAYPAPASDQNLKVMETYRKEFPKVLVGFSDNSGDVDVIMAAVYMKAVLIETNITMDRKLEGPDHRISNNPSEFRDMVRRIREIERNPASFKTIFNSSKVRSAVGDGQKRVMSSEISTMKIARKSIVAAHNLRKGSKLKENMLSARRPMGGLSPMEYGKLLERRLVRTAKKGDLLTLDDVK